MKLPNFDIPCDLPDIPFSVEQEYVTLQDLETGRYISSPESFGEYDDFSDDSEDDYDDICRGTIELDDEFDRAIYEEKNSIVTKVDEVKETEDEK